jgi:hypothetical protein
MYKKISPLLVFLVWTTSASAIPIVVNITQLAPIPHGPQDTSLGSFSQLSPSNIEFTIGSEFEFFIAPQPWAFVGSGQGSLSYVDGTGCSMSHFLDFGSGEIAFIDQWGGCYYSDVVNNAAEAGAVGVVMGTHHNDVSGLALGFASPVRIAAVVVNSSVTTHFFDTLTSSEIVLPTTPALFGIGLIFLICNRRTKR